MSEKTKTRQQRPGRKLMFPKGRTVSFKTDRTKADRYTRAAYARNIPFSMWMREAAEEKMARELAAA